MRLNTAIAIIGFLLLIGGLWPYYPPLAMIVAGAILLALGVGSHFWRKCSRRFR